MAINWGLIDPNAPARAAAAPLQAMTQTYGGLQAIGAETQRQKANALANKAAEEGMAAKKDLRNIYKQGGDVAQNLLAGGFGEEAQKYKANEMSQQLTGLKQSKAEVENALQMYGAIGQIAGTVQDQQTYDMAREQIAQINPDAAANMPDAYDPAMIEQNKMKALSVQEQLFNSYKELEYDIRQRELELKESGKGSAPEYYTYRETPQGLLRLSARTRDTEYVDLGDEPIIGSASSPELQEKLAGAKARGKLTEEYKQVPAIESKTVSAKEAAKKSAESFERLEKIRVNIRNIGEAIRLVDEGAETGAVASKLPSVRAASVKLDNLQGRLGLDVIGNTTFGALSESELKFALSTALPTKLQGPELKNWLIKKRDAQQKLADYIEDSAIFLGTPGNTVAEWHKMKREEAGSEQGDVRPPGTAFEGVNPKTGKTEYFDSEGNRL